MIAHNNMEWAEFYSMIISEWDKNKKNSKLKYNAIHNIFKDVQPDDNNLISSLRAEVESELQVTGLFALLATLVTITSGFITNNFFSSSSSKEFLDTIVFASILLFLVIGICCLTIKFFRLLKRYKFILCIIEDFQKENIITDRQDAQEKY